MVNPMLVEGRIRGGVAQGIGTALIGAAVNETPVTSQRVQAAIRKARAG